MTVAFKTFGCRLNRAETAQFEGALVAAGFQRVAFGQRADIVVIHTCAVTQAAENECLKLIRSLRKKEPATVLVVTGCAAESVPPEALQPLGIDLVVSREKKDDLACILMRHLGMVQSTTHPVPLRTTKRASLKIQDGCDFFCSYCIVPHTRGRPRSRPFEECLREARAFIDAGFQELVVTGCNIACYADGARGLVDLLAALATLPGLGRLRLGSIEPGTVERKVARLMADSETICKFLHLPIQSGDDGILTRMKRRYTAEQIVQTLDETVRLMPQVGLGADIITGFPGETLQAFEHTRSLLSAFPFSNLHVFPYSERPGTPAATFPGAVPETERKRRAAVLNRMKTGKRIAFATQFVGQKVDVLIERFASNGEAHGWTSEYVDCRISGLDPSAVATLVSCVPHATEGDQLLARKALPPVDTDAVQNR
ncbi:MAG TPA: MiaB/RimO family radical SAM methylthiotransferase [Kiritimatiellia bacterium]|nr:MiaB/RimO family radical SAM methylthiotransferase [Kiritimatiellia bacterium]HPS08493.1 MiaB/RimO family radical SAM methylthiotransferase [Kiritimatiellia bacterium]